MLAVTAPVTSNPPFACISSVNVLTPPIDCAPVFRITELSTAISFAFAVIPVPPTTFTVILPEDPPPVNPVPAVKFINLPCTEDEKFVDAKTVSKVPDVNLCLWFPLANSATLPSEAEVPISSGSEV